MSAPQVKLTYFHGAGRAEVARLSFAFGNVDFVDERVTGEEFAALKPTLPLGQLPTLTVDGTVHSQSMAIMRYAAKVSGLFPEDPVQALRVDMISESLVDLVNTMVNIMLVEKDEAAKAEKTKKFVGETIPKTLGVLESFVQGKFFLGDDKPSYADVQLFDLMHNGLKPRLPEVSTSAFPKLEAVMESGTNEIGRALSIAVLSESSNSSATGGNAVSLIVMQRGICTRECARKGGSTVTRCNVVKTTVDSAHEDAIRKAASAMERAMTNTNIAVLFIVAAEILALAVQQDPHLEGIPVTRSGAEPHLISTFVDDSAVFLKQGKQLPRLMQLLSEFGQQSGLHVQPTKSSFICLNTAVVQEQRCGIPVLKHGETVRYLGIQIGTGNITQANWEDRLQKLRTRLIIAAKVSNSVVGRVLLLNSVLLPSILFTAGYIKPPAKVVDQLVNLQKQFLWKSTLGTDGTRHKVSPSLLYLPVKEGGIGLYSIPLAIKRQAMRRTTRWLQRARDKYTEAWHEQVHRDKSQNRGCCAISPKERSQLAQTRLYQTNNIHRLGWEYLCEDLVVAERRNPAWKDDLKQQMESLLLTLDLEWRSDGRVGVYFGRKPEQTIHQLSEETRAFWPSFQWNDNPWIIDSQGEQYTVKKVPFLKECNLTSFNVRREEERVFSVRLPTMTATLTFKRMTALRKLVTSIILCSPEIEIDAGNQLNSHQEPWSRKHTKREYKWISNGMGTIIAVPVSEGSHTDYIQMQRQANGVLWTVTDWVGNATCQQDVAMIEEEIKTVGWTFKPHPLTTHCPWLVHERTPPNSVQKTIDQARTRRLHSQLHQGLGGFIDKLNEVARTDQWYSHVQYQLPADLWKQRGCLTPYQMWTTYRKSTMQLNLFHPGRIESSACPSNAGCGETKETISHIVWSCKRAQAAWTAFLERWMGRTLTEQALNLFLPHIASRTAPPGQRSLLRELEKHFGFITPEHSTALQKLWFIVTSSIPVLLWRTRVEIVHERQHLVIEESTQRVWTACVMQVRAVAHRMRTLKGEKINATCLSQLLSVLERQDLSHQLEAWATARLYFDGGARGNPGPGGSGWALIFLNERSNRWELKACGYAYMGPEVTDNWCEYSALKDGLAYSAHYPQHYEVKMEVFGDSQTIIAAQNGFSSIRQTKLQPLAVRVNQIIANFAWTSWNHTKREQNKMADLLANMAMISKSAKILTVEPRGNDQVLLSQIAALLGNDIGAIPSKLRNISLFGYLEKSNSGKLDFQDWKLPERETGLHGAELRSGHASIFECHAAEREEKTRKFSATGDTKVRELQGRRHRTSLRYALEGDLDVWRKIVEWDERTWSPGKSSNDVCGRCTECNCTRPHVELQY
ncbi:Rxlr effector protein, partial [Globisporangium splendens]